MESSTEILQNRARRAAHTEGGNETGIPCVTAWRFTTEKTQMPKTDNPYLYLVLDGMLRLYTPSGILDYMAGQYSVSRIDTPLSGIVLTFSQQQDFLALSVEFTVNEVVTAVLGLDNELTEKIMGGKLEEETMAAADAAVFMAVSRLFPVIEQAPRSEFIRRNITHN